MSADSTRREFLAAIGCPVEWAQLPPTDLVDRLATRLAAPDWDCAEPQDDDPRLAAEMALVDASGLLDPEWYAAHNPDLDGEAPLRHFCRVGWRRLLRPSQDFDVWWYWAQHLDPAREALNPLVHHVLVGADLGWTGLPTSTATTSAYAPPSGRDVRRICLLAGYDRDGVVDDVVVAYATELARFADVYYLHDGHLEPEQLDRLAGVTRGAWGVRHGAYDFGSYAMLARDLVGWEVIEDYDELLLVNDSCYLLGPLDDVFATMDARACDWWGLQATKGLALTAGTEANSFTEPIPMATVRAERLDDYERDAVYDFHVGSYFVALRRPVITGPLLRRLLDSVHRQRGKLLIIEKYEIGLTHLLIGTGHGVETYVEALHPFHPLFTETHFALIEQGFPLLKKYLLHQNHYDVPGLREWPDRIRALAPGADVAAMERDLLRTSPHDRLTRSYAIVRDPDGSVRTPQLLDRDRFAAEDALTPTFEHWWAFPVSAREHTLSEDSRAIFEEVRDDPTITKIVLTRSRYVDLDGPGVVVAPLASPEGQHHLLRAGHLFLDDRPFAAVQLPVATPRRRIVLVRDGFSLVRSERSRRVVRDPAADRRRDRPTLLAASRVDQLARLAEEYPAAYDDCWRTGAPGLDLLLRDHGRLPADLAAQETALRERLGGRRLVVLATGRGRSDGPHPAVDGSMQEWSAWLADWGRRHDAVLGLREHPADADRAYRRLLGPTVLDLSVRREPSRAVVLRVADALVSDLSGSAVSFLATGRPVIGLVPDLEEVQGDLVHDLGVVLPGALAQTLDELSAALETVFEVPDDLARRRYARTRDLFHDHLDDQNAWRAVARLRRNYVEAAYR